MPDDDQIPDAATNAQPEQDALQVPKLRVGDPFAISYDADLLDTKEGGGCVAVLQCDCKQKFRINLLDSGTKYCPKCKTAFTHVLLVGGETNTELIEAAMTTVLVANGLREPNPDDEDDDGEGDEEDDEDDDGEGDEEDGEPE